MLLLLLAILIILIYVFFKKRYNYWSQKGIQADKQLKAFRNDFIPYYKLTLKQLLANIYNNYPNDRYIAIYDAITPILIIKDIELIKTITVKHFNHFTDHYTIFPDDYDKYWNKNLFAARGHKWRKMRTTLSPVFTGAKMKAMFQLMSKCSVQFAQYFKDHPKEAVSMNLKDTCTCFANDIITTCVIGFECNTLEDKSNKFYSLAKKTGISKHFATSTVFFILTTIPELCKVLKFDVIDKESLNFFEKFISESVNYRRENKIIRNDMIDLLNEAMEENNNDNGKGEDTKYYVSDEDIIAHTLTFYIAGFETISTVMGFLGYELAVNPDVQDKLYQEIMDTELSCKGSITYDALNKMKYLDMVVSEVLRKWPAGLLIDRVCVQPFTIPPQGEYEQPVHLQTGDVIWIPTLNIHRDPQFYPNPEVFDPERFNDDNKHKIHPYAYLPFGTGPRKCIAYRFAILEIKILFYHLLQHFELVPNADTEIPLSFTNNYLALIAENGVWLGFKPRC